VLAWECLTGARLFRRATDAARVAAVTKDPIAPPSTKRPEVSPALDAVAGA
jgi:hypothetical protein